MAEQAKGGGLGRSRARQVRESTPDNDTEATGAAAFTLTRAELAGLVEQAVDRALDARRAAAPVAHLLDRSQLALALDCGAGLVDKLRREGMPCVYLGDSPRFDYARVLSWLEARKGARS